MYNIFVYMIIDYDTYMLDCKNRKNTSKLIFPTNPTNFLYNAFWFVYSYSQSVKIHRKQDPIKRTKVS